MKWRIVSFNHPASTKSLLYRQDLSDEELLKAIKDSIDRGCNLMKIRGVD